jgi:hypothetical protein
VFPPDVHIELRGINVPALVVPIAQDAAVELTEGRQAVGVHASGLGGVPDLPLDENPGPAAAIGHEQTARMVQSIVDESLLLTRWSRARRC